MGKNRKGKGRFAKAKDVNDVLDEQMIDSIPDENAYAKRSRVEKNIYTKGRIPGKINRNQKRNRKNNNAQQKNIIQKGKLFANANHSDNQLEGSSGVDLRGLIDTKKQFHSASSGWSKITLVDGARVPRETLFEHLSKFCSIPFSPICLATQGKYDLSFYVEKTIEANAIKNCDKMTIHIDSHLSMNEDTPKEHKLNIRAVSSRPPDTTINSKVLQVMKTAMAKRYMGDVKALDMKAFHTDPSFVGESVYVPLARSVVLIEVIKIIAQEIPDVEAIDFSSNRLPSLYQLTKLAESAKKIRILYLSDNRLANITELRFLKHMKNLSEIKIDGNLAIEKRLGTDLDLKKATQKILPNLQTINGDNNLPKVILFEDDEDAPQIILPGVQKKMLGSSVDGKVDNLVGQFLEQYFKLFDSENRLPLEAAYHQEAMFSLSVAHEPGSSNKYSARSLSEFQGDIRNLLVVKNMTKRFRLLRKGKLSVIDYLVNHFPITKHDVSSFTLDIPFVVASELLEAGSGFIGPITVGGVFQQCETTPNHPKEGSNELLHHHFNHTFILVPQGQGIVIINETLVIRPLSAQQIQDLTPCTSAGNISLDTQENEVKLQSMVVSLGNMTKMNLEWCKRCLEETGWDLQIAFNSFNSANSKGQIPPEAFN